MTIFGREISKADMDNIATYMNDDIREQLHSDIAPCTHEEFIAAYIERDPKFEEFLESEFNFEA